MSDHNKSEENRTATEEVSETHLKSEEEEEVLPVSTRKESLDKPTDTEKVVRSQHDIDEKPYSVFTYNEKRLIALCCGMAAFFSPVSGQIYFPSLPSIAKDLNVSMTLVNFSITSYIIMQAIAPAFVGQFSDASGRRSAYLFCFLIYFAANLGLALQNSYPALIVLRCLQSMGSSGTVTLANAVVADMVTSAERGVYVSYMSVPAQAGPSLGPIIGGLLGQFLGWHSIFWFLLIWCGVIFVLASFFLAETNRRVVDDGSIPPPKLLRSYINHRVEARLISQGHPIDYARRDELTAKRKLRFPNPFGAVKIVFTKEAGFILLYIGLLCCLYYATVALVPSQFGEIYHFNQLQISLCYLPLGFGALTAGFVRGRFIDANYKRWAKKLDFPLVYNKRVDLSNFPIERVRLEVAVPTLAMGSLCSIGFGWMVQYHVNLAGPLIFLYIIGFSVSASMNTVSVLLIDLFPGKAGQASAAANLVRCGLGAAATAGVQPLIDKVGIGWASTFFALLVIGFSPILWYVMVNGPKWRRATKEKKEREEADKMKKVGEVKGEKVTKGGIDGTQVKV